VAFFLFTSLAAVNHALNVNVSSINQYRLMTNHKVSITRSLAVNYQQKIAALEGVKAVTYASWFGGYFQSEKNQLAVTAVEHQSYFTLFDEYQIPSEQLTRWQNTRTGVIIGQGIADKYGWKVGDQIPLSSSIWMNKQGSFSWQFVVSAIYQTSDSSVDDKRVFFQHAYFDKARAYAKYMVSWLSTSINQSADVEQVSALIDQNFANSNAPTRTVTEQVFIKEQTQQFVDMAMVIKVVLIAVFSTLLLIVCNTMMQISRERIHESAMMKALGFSSNKLIIQVYLESLFLLVLGAFSGSLLAGISLQFIKQSFAEFLPGIAIASQHYLVVFVVVVIAAIISSLFPALAIKRLVISKTLGAIA